MSLFTTSSLITITCNNRLAPYLKMEVEALEYEILEVFSTGLIIKGTLNDCIRLNLNLRTASQVLYSLISFNARNADDIYAEAGELPWENILPDPAYFSVTSNVQNDSINNNLFANLRVKDAVVDRFRSLGLQRPNSGSTLSGSVIHLFWKNEEAEIFLNTSGDSLGRHGYRKIPGEAPMLEALAAATILATKWDQKTPFINPMCGSGTLAIEAALLSSHTAPGLFRTNFAFMHLKDYQEEAYLKERGKAEQAIDEKNCPKIIASDHSEEAIENAKKNAKAAGVYSLIDFEVCDFSETTVPNEEQGIIFFNPEYGLRLGEISKLATTYSEIGDFLKQNCKGYTGYIFTGNRELSKKIGLKAKRKIEFYNGKVDCRLFEYELYPGTKQISRES